MLITFFKSLADDIHMLESTWHHVSEQEGMRLQHEDELTRTMDIFRDEHGREPRFAHLTTRRIVRGKFHPGRRVLPPGAVYYELVYEFTGIGEIGENEFIDYMRDTCYTDDVEMSGSMELGDQTNEKEENVA